MKRLMFAVVALALLGGAACTTETNLGQCIGVADDEDPRFRYKVSAWILCVDIFFIETLVVPIIGVVDDFKCPVAVRAVPSDPP